MTIAEAYEQVFPNGEPDIQPEPFHLAIRDMLMEIYMKEFQMRHRPEVDDRFIIRGFRLMADGRTLFPDTMDTVPKHRKASYNRYCLDNLDYPGGDDIMQVGVLKPTTVLKNLRLFKKGGLFKPSNILKNVSNYIFMRIVGSGHERRSASCSQC